MMTICHDDLEEASRQHTSAPTQSRNRAVLVVGGFQVACGAWWLGRALTPLTSVLVGSLVGAVVVLSGISVTWGLLSSAPRPRGALARRVERRLGAVTLLQVALSILVAWPLNALHAQRLDLPFIMASTGALLLWIHHEVGAPFQAMAGRFLLVLSVVTIFLTGTSEIVFAGISSATVLLGYASAGYHWLEHHELDD